MLKKRKKRDEHENHERWLITYSDLITLLLVFFIVLYSMSEVKNDKFNALVESLRTTFSGDAVVNQSNNPPTTTSEIPKSIDHSDESKSKQNETDTNEEDEDKLDALYVQLQEYIDKNNLATKIELDNIPRGVQITLKEKILFDLGKADIKKDAKNIMESMGGILNSVSNPITVEGHTDNNPIISSSEFNSNWELASKRAENVMLFLIQNDGIKPSRMRYTSYGEYHPIVKNDTKTHQAMNRRVNIVILRETSATQD